MITNPTTTPDQKAEILIQALPYLREFAGKTIVVKYGGNAMIDEDLKRAVMTDIVLMRYVGINPILVHGGGPEVNEAMARMGKEPAFVSGLRVTTPRRWKSSRWCLPAKRTRTSCPHLNQEGGRAVGLSGKDANLLVAAKGNAARRHRLCRAHRAGQSRHYPHADQGGYIPVISSVAVGSDGASYNVNADTAAGELAGALGATKLILMTDVEGVRRDPKNPPRSSARSRSTRRRECLIPGPPTRA
jgi:acetylglutamate kinase